MKKEFKTFYVDQTDPISIKDMFKNIGKKKFDIILEDGLHEYNANICFFENAINFLDNGGTYIIEMFTIKIKKNSLNIFKIQIIIFPS